MKKLVLAAALSAFTAPAYAGTMEPPVMEPPVIVEDTQQTSTAAGVIIPLILIAMIVAIADD